MTKNKERATWSTEHLKVSSTAAFNQMEWFMIIAALQKQADYFEKEARSEALAKNHRELIDIAQAAFKSAKPLTG